MKKWILHLSETKLAVSRYPTLAGAIIGGAAALSCCTSNQYLAALFFSIGLLYIRIEKLWLFTGQIQNIRKKSITFPELIVGFINNCLGVTLVFWLAMVIFTYREDAAIKYVTTVNNKWVYSWLYYLFSGAFCGGLMTIATDKNAPLFVSILCVCAFILAGFNHSIADYFYLLSSFTKDNFLSWIWIVIGNFIGGWLVATSD